MSDATTYVSLTSDPREHSAGTFRRHLKELASCFPEGNMASLDVDSLSTKVPLDGILAFLVRKLPTEDLDSLCPSV